jgi:hypothetical protein
MVALIALTGCDNKPSEAAQNTTSAPSGTIAPKVAAAKITNACSLLTQQEVASAMGAPVGAGEDGSHDNIPWPSCTWDPVDVTRGGVTLLIKPAPDGRLDEACKRLDGLGSEACATGDSDNRMWEMEALIGDQMLGIQFVDNKRDVEASKDSAVSLLKAALARVR